jgi:high-affinity iron transporter
MVASYLLSLREGLEAALVIGIVLGVLLKLKRTDLNKSVWTGVGVAVLLSIAVAVALNVLDMEFEGTGEQIFEGATMLLAAGVLTWMILWVHHSSRDLKREIEDKTHRAVRGLGGSGLFSLAFLAVFREGIELALFLLAVEKTSSPMQTLIGGLAGLATATVLGLVLFTSARRLNLRSFFQATNVLLIIFAAGMVATGVHEFNEAGLIPSVIEHVWDVNGLVSDNGQVGLLLKALVGYNGNPSLTEVIAYMAYLGGIVALLLSRKQDAPAVVGTAAQ